MAQSGAKLEKAHLIIVEPPPKGTKPPSLSSVEGAARQGEIKFQFNPKEYTIKKSAKWERKAAKGSKAAVMPEFMGPEPRVLDLEIFLDKSDSDGDVIKEVEALFRCLQPTSKSTQDKKPSPPWVLFGWGTLVSFVAIVKSVSAKYTLFRPNGKPIRAVCTVSLEEVPTEPLPKQNPTSGGKTVLRTYQIVAGDTLPSVAFAEYDDPTLWRALAAVNRIDDPFRVPAGTSLRIPSAAEAAAYR